MLRANASSRTVSAPPQKSALKKSLLLHVAVLGLIVLLPYLHMPPKVVEPPVIEAVLVSPRAVTPPQPEPKPQPVPEPQPQPKPEPKPEPVPPPKPVEPPPVAKEVPKIALPKPVEKKPVPEKPVAKPEPVKPAPVKPLIKQPTLNRNAIDDEMAALQKEVEQSELNRLKAEADKAAQAARSSADVAIRDQYMRKINQRLQTKWNRPLTARNGMETTLRITVLPGGEVSNVLSLKGSGDAAFDASAVEAVWKSSPLPVPPDAAVFNQYFRVFTLKFNPEDL